ncbi:putative small integral membrane protein [Candidatus Rubidus massiliensis]|nr:putative small integral membrane protein [Candidatus Rubidus massiliensis]
MFLKNKLSYFINWSAKTAGNPFTFVIALIILFIWLLIGLWRGFSAEWLLILDTIATINASLMVFIIQNTQLRENKALHLKIDGLIKATKDVTNELIAIETAEEEKIEKLRSELIDDL